MSGISKFPKSNIINLFKKCLNEIHTIVAITYSILSNEVNDDAKDYENEKINVNDHSDYNKEYDEDVDDSEIMYKVYVDDDSDYEEEDDNDSDEDFRIYTEYIKRNNKKIIH